jgi:hypothetical protein
MRNINAVALGSLEDGFARIGVEGVAIELELERLGQNFSHFCWRVHAVAPISGAKYF